MSVTMPSAHSPVRRGFFGILWALAAAQMISKGQADELPSLEKALLQQAPAVLRFAQERGYKNIGVLKFRIREGLAQPSDRNGLLNRNLAERLELALIIKNRPASSVGIVHDASQVAASISGSTHLTSEGRAKLFSKTYPLAWGLNKVIPDAFVVGVVQVESDFKTVTVGLSAFGQNDAKLLDIVKFPASLTTNDLVELGGSFSTRSTFGGGEVVLTEDLREAKVRDAVSKQLSDIKTNTARHPLNDNSSPVKVTIKYDGQSIPIEFRDGGAFVKEPTERQKVSFVIHRANPADKARYGVVLRVNGENTLYRQRLKDLDCSKWILEPGHPPIQVDGYQLNEKDLQQFQVLSKRTSRGKEMDYGADVGTISFVVFQVKKDSNPAPSAVDLLSDDAEDFAILSRGTFPLQQPDSLEALKSQLAMQTRSRGLITEGETVAGAIRRVTFEADPVPLMAASITYYQK